MYKGPYLFTNEYGVAIDIPTDYNAGTDYMVRIKWDDNRFNQSWTKEIEERSEFVHDGRKLDIKPNYTDPFKEGSHFVHLPID